jgi:hypothetical protein
MGLDHSHQSVKTSKGDCYKLDRIPDNRPQTNRESVVNYFVGPIGKTAMNTWLYSNIRHVFKGFFLGTEQEYKVLAHIALGFVKGSVTTQVVRAPTQPPKTPIPQLYPMSAFGAERLNVSHTVTCVTI